MTERPASLPSLTFREPPPPPWRRLAPRVRTRPWWRPSIPWTLYRYLGGDVLRITCLGVFAVSLLYTTLAAYQTARSGLQLQFLWPLLLRTLAYPLYFSLPISFLFAVTLVFGRLVGDLEVNAFRTHGISYRQIYIPVVLLGLALSGVSFWVNGWVVPDIHFARRNLQAYILRQIENLGSGVNRTILLPGNEGSLWVESYSGKDLSQVQLDFKATPRSALLPVLRDHLPGRSPRSVRILANRGRIDVLPDRQTVMLSLRSVQILVPEAVKTARIANEVFHQTASVTDNIVIPLSFAPKAPGIKDRTNTELLEHIAALRAGRYETEAAEDPGDDVDPEAQEGAALARASFRGGPDSAVRKQRLAVAATELHRRIAFTISCAAFAVLGVALALLLDRWGRLVPFFAGNIILIAVYYPLLILGVFLGEQGVWPAVALAIPNVAILSLGIYLTRTVVQR